MAQLIGYFCISSQWARCSTFKYLASACCSSCIALKKPSTFPSSTCIDLLRGDSCMLWGLFHICYMCSSSISYMLTAGCCGCIGSRKSRYLVCYSNNISRSIPPRPNTLPLSCTLPCQSLRELSWQNYTLLYFWSNVLVIIKDFFQKHFL